VSVNSMASVLYFIGMNCVSYLLRNLFCGSFSVLDSLLNDADCFRSRSNRGRTSFGSIDRS
jgi:hypothetical protein